MTHALDDHAKRRLQALFEKGAEEASVALSKWLGQPATIETSEVDDVDLIEASELLGPPESLVAACSMELAGLIKGQLLLVFKDRSGLALADLLLRQAVGTASLWGELEQSAANETANIVGCSYLNAIATYLIRSGMGTEEEHRTILPSPPTFRHEFAGSLLEFALMDQAITQDRLILIKTRFEAQEKTLDWSLLLVPDRESLEKLLDCLARDGKDPE